MILHGFPDILTAVLLSSLLCIYQPHPSQIRASSSHFLDQIICTLLPPLPLLPYFLPRQWFLCTLLVSEVIPEYMLTSKDLEPMMSENIQCLSLWAWITSLNMIYSSFIYLPG